jgi:LysM repeat protein
MSLKSDIWKGACKKTTPNKKEKLTTYYSIKKRYGQTLAVIISPATLLARGYN